ncbi:gag-pol polyprotein, partial [Tanacetum coccineum]
MVAMSEQGVSNGPIGTGLFPSSYLTKFRPFGPRWELFGERDRDPRYGAARIRCFHEIFTYGPAGPEFTCFTSDILHRVLSVTVGRVHGVVFYRYRVFSNALKYVTQARLAKRLTEYYYDDLFDYLQQFEKLVNSSREKKLEKYHDPLALVAHTGSSSRTSSSYYVTHPSSVVDYDDDYQGDTVQNSSDDPLTSTMILLDRAITRNFSNLTNNRLRTSSNTRNQAIVQGDRVNIQSKNSSNDGRNTRRSYVQEEVIERIVANVQCYNCSEEGHYARNCPKPRIRDSKYFMEQMLLAKQDEAGVILTDEQNVFLFADVSRMEEIEELSANIYLMARIQPADIDGSSNDSAFLSE